MQKKLLVGGSVVGAVVVGGTAFAVAAVIYRAGQTGYNQSGGGQAATLTIRVESAIADPNNDLLPDITTVGNCPPAPASQIPHLPPSSTACPGGALQFTIENKSDVPLRVTDVEQRVCPTFNSPTNPCQINSDKNSDGSYAVAPENGSCYIFASFLPPLLNPIYAGSRPWPVIPAHGTLQVNGGDPNALGVGLIHLSSTTPSACQGATYEIPLDVTAQDARAAVYPF